MNFHSYFSVQMFDIHSSRGAPKNDALGRHKRITQYDRTVMATVFKLLHLEIAKSDGV